MNFSKIPQCIVLQNFCVVGAKLFHASSRRDVMKLVAAFCRLLYRCICTGSLSKFKTCGTKDLSIDH